MKMHTNDEDVMFGSGFKGTGFRINAGRKAFQVLSDKLYKDKAEAVLRELSCNAVDIHCEMGKADVPFNVTLPSAIFPWFVIRDFGTGLSPDQITNIFTVYFASTKDDSNDSIGGFGLGCKSPFAYNETGGGFTVKSYQNGTCTVYNMYMDDGEPFSAKMSCTPSGEPDGLEILVPIPEAEHARWKTIAKKVYRAFNLCQPKIVNGIDIDINSFPDQDQFFFSDEFGQSGSVYAVVGGVVYPIPGRLIEQDMCFRYAGMPAYVRFDIGVLDISPSREELSMDQSTEKAIRERLAEFSVSYVDTIKEGFTGITDKREAAQKAIKYNQHIKAAIGNLEISGERIDRIIDRYTSTVGLNEIEVYVPMNGKPKKKFTQTGYSWRPSSIETHKVFGINERKVHILINDTAESVSNMVGAYWHSLGVGAYDAPRTVIIHKTRRLNKKDYAKYANKMSRICQKFDSSERTILKFSEMTELRKAYTKHKRKTADPKPAKPNAYRFYLDETDSRQTETLYLTNDEIKNLTGVAVIKYADEYDRISLKSSSSQLRRVPNRLYDAGLTEFYVIDNNKRAQVAKSQLVCGFKWAHDKIMSTVTKFDVLDGYCNLIDDYDTANRLVEMGLLDIEISKVSYPNDLFLHEAAEWIEVGNPQFDEYFKVKKEVEEENEKYAAKFAKAVAEVKANNALLFAVASSDIELTNEIMKDIQNVRAR